MCHCVPGIIIALLRAALDAVTFGASESLLGRIAILATKRSLESDSVSPRFLVIGLGNPGASFDGTRHNVGRALLERLTKAQHFGEWRSCDGALVADGTLGGHAVLAVQPNSFMNLSGRCVKKLVSRHGLDARECLVLHDDLDLPAGRVKVKFGGSSGGQKGVESVANSLQSVDFGRLRIGIGRPVTKADVPNFVLEEFRAEELATLTPLFERLVADELAHMMPDLREEKARSTFLNLLAKPCLTAAPGAMEAVGSGHGKHPKAPLPPESSQYTESTSSMAPPPKKQQSYGATSLSAALPDVLVAVAEDCQVSGTGTAPTPSKETTQ